MAAERKPRFELRAVLALLLVLGSAPWLTGCNDSDSPAMASSSSSTATVSAEQAEQETAQDAPQDEPPPASDGDAAPPAAETASAADDVGREESAAKKTAPADARPPATADISFDDIKFDIQPDEPFERSMLTEKIEKLADRPIRIRGFILPSFQQTGLTQFVLVRDNLSCCFGPGAALYDCIVVEMKPGKSTDFSLYPVAVEGTFSIQEMRDPDGKALAIYHLDGESVR